VRGQGGEKERKASRNETGRQRRLLETISAAEKTGPLYWENSDAPPSL
jgi:hypothetical protein